MHTSMQPKSSMDDTSDILPDLTIDIDRLGHSPGQKYILIGTQSHPQGPKKEQGVDPRTWLLSQLSGLQAHGFRPLLPGCVGIARGVPNIVWI